MKTYYTTAVEQYLISELQQHRLTELDFSSYDPVPQPQITYSGHTSCITCIAVLPNGQLVSGSQDSTARIWDVRTGESLKTLTGHTATVAYIDAVPGLLDGQVASIGQDNTSRIWDMRTGKCIKTLAVDRLYEGSLFILPNDYENRMFLQSRLNVLPNGYVVNKSSGIDTTFRLVEVMRTGKIFNITGHTDYITCVAVLPDRQQMVSGSLDNTIRVWNLLTGECLRTLTGHTDSVTCVAVLPNGQVVSGSRDKTLRVWDVLTGECLMTLNEHTDSVNCIAVLPNGQVVSGSLDRTLRVWAPHTRQCLKTLTGHTHSVNCVAVLPNGQVVSGSSDNTLKCWTPFPRLSYDMIAPVLAAIDPKCGLQHLSLQGVSLWPVGYDHIRQLVQNMPSLKTLNLLETGLTSAQIQTLNQLVHQHRVIHRQRKTQAQAERDQLLQAQAKRLQKLESQLQTLQAHHAQQDNPIVLPYPEVVFTCPVIEEPYHRIEEEAVPDECLCPITRQIMWEPVMADDGYTYEKAVIEAHLQRTLTSPMLPDEPLSQRLVVNRNVRSAIQRLLERHPGWALYQPDSVYFSSDYDVMVQAAITANDIPALLRAIEQEPRLLTRSLPRGVLIAQVWHQAELLEAVMQRLTPAMWSHLIQAEGGISVCLAKLANLAMPSLESHLQRFTVFLQALQVGLSCQYPAEALVAQGLHQALPVLLLHGLNQLAGIDTRLDEQQNTALHYAAASGSLLLVKTLVQQGATLTLKNQAGQTPKALAQLGGHDEVVAYCQQTKLQPLMSRLLGNLGFLNVHQHQALREKIEQQEATILKLQTQLQAQDQELQSFRGSSAVITPTGD